MFYEGIYIWSLETFIPYEILHLIRYNQDLVCLRTIIIQVEETAGCNGDYLQFGRDTFIVTDRTSPKFCNKVTKGK